MGDGWARYVFIVLAIVGFAFLAIVAAMGVGKVSTYGAW